MILTKFVNCKSANKSCHCINVYKNYHFQFLHRKAIAALTQFCIFFIVYYFKITPPFSNFDESGVDVPYPSPLNRFLSKQYYVHTCDRQFYSNLHFQIYLIQDAILSNHLDVTKLNIKHIRWLHNYEK